MAATPRDPPPNAPLGVLTPPAFIPSKTRVNLAGARLAEARRFGRQLPTDEMLEAIRVVDAWRQLHAEPLAWVTNALMRRLEPIALHVVVAQRLKRMPQIIKKLARYESMQLARMHDIAGCRVVLDTAAEIDQAARLIRSYGTNRWTIRDEDDYRADGRPDTGYRALHIILVRDERWIEVQLRTQRQHAWAEAVERVTALSDHDVKEGRAPEEFLEYFKLASDGLHMLDNEVRPSPTLRTRFARLHQEFGSYVLAA